MFHILNLHFCFPAHRNPTDFCILILRSANFPNLSINYRGFFFFLDSLRFSTERIISSMNKNSF